MAENPAPDQRPVTFDLMSKDPDWYFVLAEALSDFAVQQRGEAADNPDDPTAESRTRWAETAERAVDRIENALSRHPAAIAGTDSLSSAIRGMRQQAEWEARQPSPARSSAYVPVLAGGLAAVLKLADEWTDGDYSTGSALDEDRAWVRAECGAKLREAINRELFGGNDHG